MLQMMIGFPDCALADSEGIQSANEFTFNNVLDFAFPAWSLFSRLLSPVIPHYAPMTSKTDTRWISHSHQRASAVYTSFVNGHGSRRKTIPYSTRFEGWDQQRVRYDVPSAWAVTEVEPASKPDPGRRKILGETREMVCVEFGEHCEGHSVGCNPAAAMHPAGYVRRSTSRTGRGVGDRQRLATPHYVRYVFHPYGRRLNSAKYQHTTSSTFHRRHERGRE